MNGSSLLVCGETWRARTAFRHESAHSVLVLRSRTQLARENLGTNHRGSKRVVGDGPSVDLRYIIGL